MVAANTTFFVAPRLEKAFVEWIRSTYSPAVRAAKFSEPRLMKLLERPDPNLEAYAFQFLAENAEEAYSWTEGSESQRLRCEFAAQSPQECVWFTTLMQLVEL